MQSGFICLVRCQLCGQEYIGKTGRLLRLRIEAHSEGLRRYNASTPLRTHRNAYHGNTEPCYNYYTTRVAEIVARKALKAFWI